MKLVQLMAKGSTEEVAELITRGLFGRFKKELREENML